MNRQYREETDVTMLGHLQRVEKGELLQLHFLIFLAAGWPRLIKIFDSRVTSNVRPDVEREFWALIKKTNFRTRLETARRIF